MARTRFLAASRQLAAAAEILAKAGRRDGRLDAFQALAFFRQFDQPGLVLNAGETSDDELFARTSDPL
ncbi:hypothetical protein [Paraburkholderia youngii]|uniref:hypothetical protein n=1 Tax=Paraburkholderia youngii TaxID=2782701 RepID=UPI001C37C8A9|nr:hypothetical protein [Paraburkholderia youngii]